MSDSHIHDFEAHVRAVEEDLEYYRTKRLEPRVLFLARRGILTLYGLLKAAKPDAPVATNDGTLEERIRSLEDRLDAYVTEIGVLSINELDVVIEDTRKERGGYDPFFRIAKRHHNGSLEKRVAQLDCELGDGEYLLRVLHRELVKIGTPHEQEPEPRASELAET